MSSVTATSSSRVLQCLELCRLICEQIGRKDKFTLFQLCLSCKAMMQPALDLLWYQLDSLVPLMRCLPWDLYEEDVMWREDLQRDVVLIVIHILTHSDIVGATENDKVYQFDSWIFQSLACAQQGTSKLLPRLQQLTWSVQNDDVYPFIQLFLSRSIRHLKVFMIVTRENTSLRMRFSLLTSLVSHCPSIQSMVLDAENGAQYNPVISWGKLFSGRASSACAPFIAWTGLESLSLKNITLGPLTNAIARLPALTTLKLYFCRIVDTQFPNNAPNFPVLKHLAMVRCEMDSCLQVLKCMSSTPLRSINLFITGTPQEPQWAGVVNGLQNGILHDTLTDFVISSVAGRRLVTLSFQTISPLLHFRHIRSFGVYGYCTLDIDDDDVACIVKAWSKLRKFTMIPKKPVPTRLTSHALISFAKHCPGLEELSLTINADALDNYEEQLGNGTCNRALRELGVNDSPIENPGRIAAFISDMFPEVTKITVSELNEDPEEKKRKWKEVERLIPVFAAVRKQEANRKT
ncbi:hypothetical protein F5887DRAFT_947344 [Amanita rubescens]|nr:hypothetical protein F5887DRAFT_947344 [Amanita rubescens]